MVAVVGLVGRAIVVVRFSENKDVVAAAEGILEDGAGAKVDIGVVAGSLIGGRTIEVPGPELADVCYLLGNSLKAENWYEDSRKKGQRTVVFERRPLSPSIQTSED